MAPHFNLAWPDIGWLFALAVTLHNAEEAILLPRWSQQGGPWRVPVEAFEFRFAVAVLTAFAYGAAYLAAHGGPGSIGAHILAGYALAMVLNVLVPHLWGALALRRYVPGTASAILLNLPAGGYLLYSGVRDGEIGFDKFVWIGPASVAALSASIPLLFFLGRKLSRLPRRLCSIR